MNQFNSNLPSMIGTYIEFNYPAIDGEFFQTSAGRVAILHNEFRSVIAYDTKRTDLLSVLQAQKVTGIVRSKRTKLAKKFKFIEFDCPFQQQDPTYAPNHLRVNLLRICSFGSPFFDFR